MKSCEMSNEEIVARIKNGGNKKKLIEKLYYKNFGLIYNIAKPYVSSAGMDDLLQEGFFGIYAAVEKYDPEMGVSFANYAGFWIKHAVVRYCENCGSLVCMSSYKTQKVWRYKKAVADFAKEYNKNPSAEELAQYMGYTTKDIVLLQSESPKFNNALSLSYVSHDEEEEEGTLLDTLQSHLDTESEVLDKIYEEELKKLIWPIVDGLPGKAGVVLRYRFIDNKTLAETGEELGLSVSRVQGVEKAALQRLMRNRQLYSAVDVESYYTAGLRAANLTAFKRKGGSYIEKFVTDKIMHEAYNKRKVHVNRNALSYLS